MATLCHTACFSSLTVFWIIFPAPQSLNLSVTHQEILENAYHMKNSKEIHIAQDPTSLPCDLLRVKVKTDKCADLLWCEVTGVRFVYSKTLKTTVRKRQTQMH